MWARAGEVIDEACLLRWACGTFRTCQSQQRMAIIGGIANLVELVRRDAADATANVARGAGKSGLLATADAQ